jgi:hypothetical protein
MVRQKNLAVLVIRRKHNCRYGDLPVELANSRGQPRASHVWGSSRLAQFIHAALHMRLDWLGHLACHLGGQRADFLGLIR